MSEGIIIAFISVIGTVFAALIGAFGTIVAASIRGKKQDDTTKSGFSCGTIGLATSVMGILGLVGSLFLGTFIVQNMNSSALLLPTAQPENITIPESNTPFASSTAYVPPSTGATLVERQETGAETRKVYSIELLADEVIVGDSYKFQDNDVLCNAFLIEGPGYIQFAVLDGAWYRYSGVTTQQKAEDLLQGRVNYLQNHWFCKDVGVNVVRLKAGE